MKKHIASACAALLVFLFLYASLSKLADMRIFIHDMHNQPFSRPLANILIVVVPLVEIVLSAMLLFQKTIRRGFIGSLILMLLFSGYTWIILKNVFNRIPCSCGGIIRSLTWHQHLYLNLVFVAIAIAGIWASWPQKESPSAKVSYS